MFVTASSALRALLGLVVACAASSAIAADAWPDRPITLVVPTAAGGGTDVVARLYAQRLSAALGQPVIVDNRAGANGTLGTQFVARAKPDGQTVLFTYAAAHVASPSLYKSIGYDPVRDLSPVAQLARGGILLLVRGDSPMKTIKDFVAHGKAGNGNVTYCSWGIGSGGHLQMENLARQAGMSLRHIPYKGSAACTQDLIGGQVESAWGDVSSSVGMLKSGKLRALVYSGPTVLPTMPGVPTLSDAGYPSANYPWYGVFVPAKTPPAIVARLNAETIRMIGDPDFKSRMAELNLPDLTRTTPDEFGRIVVQDLAGWAKLVQDSGVQPE